MQPPEAPLRNAWYFALGSEALSQGRTLHKRVLDEPILFARDTDGKVFALLDVCPHRGIPLRSGRFDGREVECPYHGWRFDNSGACTHIPAVIDEQQPVAGRIRVRSFPVRETQGNIWVFIGEDESRAPAIPVIQGFAEDARPQLREVVELAGGIDDAVVGLMDPAHGPFIHRSWFWRSGRQLKLKEKRFEPTPWGFSMVRHKPSNARAYRILGGAPETEITFRLPSIRWEHILVGASAMCHFTTLTPITEKRTLITHSIYWTQPWLTLLRPLLRPFVRKFLKQDADVMELQQIGLAENPTRLLMADPDAQARWYYRLKQEFQRSGEEGRDFMNPIKARTLFWRT